MCIHSLDHCPVAVDLAVVVFVFLRQAAVSGFPDRVRAVPADVAFVSGDVPRLALGVGEFRLPDTPQVVPGPRLRIRDPHQVSVEITGDLEVEPGGLVFAGVEVVVVSPVPAGHQGSINHERAGEGLKVCGSGPVFVQQASDQIGEGADDAGDGGLGDAVGRGECLFSAVFAEIIQGQQDTIFHGQGTSAIGHIGELVAVLNGLDQAE